MNYLPARFYSLLQRLDLPEYEQLIQIRGEERVIAALRVVIETLPELEKEICTLYYRSYPITYKKIGVEFAPALKVNRIYALLNEAILKIAVPPRIDILITAFDQILCGEEPRDTSSNDTLDRGIDFLEISRRTRNCLWSQKLYTIRDVREYNGSFIKIQNFGVKCEKELRSAMRKIGFELP